MSKGSEIRIIKKLGEGSFSEVFMAKSSSTGETFAIKRLKKRYRSIDEVQHLPEIYALQVLQGHPNIIDLLNLSYDSNNGYVSMFFELMDYNVYELITEHKKPFDEQTTLILIYQLLKAISFIHSKNLFHRDIKPENIFISCYDDKKVAKARYDNSDYNCDLSFDTSLSTNFLLNNEDDDFRPVRAVLGDFGLAKRYSPESGMIETEEYVGTLQYCSPQVAVHVPCM